MDKILLIDLLSMSHERLQGVAFTGRRGRQPKESSWIVRWLELWQEPAPKCWPWKTRERRAP